MKQVNSTITPAIDTIKVSDTNKVSIYIKHSMKWKTLGPLERAMSPIKIYANHKLKVYYTHLKGYETIKLELNL